LAVGIRRWDVGGQTDAGAVAVLYGSPDGLHVPLMTQLLTEADAGVGQGSVADALFGRALGVGDYDQDGFVDLAVGAPRESVSEARGAGTVTVFYGGVDGLQVVEPAAQQFDAETPGIPDTLERGAWFGRHLT